MSIALASDLHLDPGDTAALRRFRAFTDALPDATREFWLLGDVFEAWIGDDADDAAACCVRDALCALAERSVRTYLMQGNRDFLLGERFAEACRSRLVDDPHLLEVDGERLLLTHGDALCTDDADYQALRRTLRMPETRSALLARSRSDRRELAAAARARSRSAGATKTAAIQDVTQHAVDAALDAAGADVMVHGHTHRPADHRWRHGDRARRRLVLGAWDAPTVHFGWLADGALELKQWR